MCSSGGPGTSGLAGQNSPSPSWWSSPCDAFRIPGEGILCVFLFLCFSLLSFLSFFLSLSVFSFLFLFFFSSSYSFLSFLDVSLSHSCSSFLQKKTPRPYPLMPCLCSWLPPHRRQLLDLLFRQVLPSKPKSGTTLLCSAPARHPSVVSALEELVCLVASSLFIFALFTPLLPDCSGQSFVSLPPPRVLFRYCIFFRLSNGTPSLPSLPTTVPSTCRTTGGGTGRRTLVHLGGWCPTG